MAAQTPTKGIVTMTAANDTYTPVGPFAQVKPQKVIWAKPTTVAHEMILQDKDGKELLHMSCGLANQDEREDFGDDQSAPWEGPITLSTLGSGKVYIYV